MNDLSIIIVSWNAKKFLLSCLRSLMNETTAAHSEIIVVDNASTDGSPELVDKLYPQVKVIRNSRNLGFSKANNIGIRKSTGKYVCLVNSDITVMKKSLGIMRSFMDMHPEIGMIGPKIFDMNGKVQKSYEKLPSLRKQLSNALALGGLFDGAKEIIRRLLFRISITDSIRNVEVLSGCFLMINRVALNRVGLLDEDYFIYAEDIDLCKRFQKAGWDIVFFPYAEVIHYGGASSSNAPLRFYLEMQKANLQYWKKHHNRLSQIVYKVVLWVHHIVRIIGYGFLYIAMPLKREKSKLKIGRSVACIRWLFQN